MIFQSSAIPFNCALLILELKFIEIGGKILKQKQYILTNTKSGFLIIEHITRHQSAASQNMPIHSGLIMEK